MAISLESPEDRIRRRRRERDELEQPAAAEDRMAPPPAAPSAMPPEVAGVDLAEERQPTFTERVEREPALAGLYEDWQGSFQNTGYPGTPDGMRLFYQNMAQMHGSDYARKMARAASERGRLGAFADAEEPDPATSLSPEAQVDAEVANIGVDLPVSVSFEAPPESVELPAAEPLPAPPESPGEPRQPLEPDMDDSLQRRASMDDQEASSQAAWADWSAANPEGAQNLKAFFLFERGRSEAMQNDYPATDEGFQQFVADVFFDDPPGEMRSALTQLSEDVAGDRKGTETSLYRMNIPDNDGDGVPDWSARSGESRGVTGVGPFGRSELGDMYDLRADGPASGLVEVETGEGPRLTRRALGQTAASEMLADPRTVLVDDTGRPYRDEQQDNFENQIRVQEGGVDLEGLTPQQRAGVARAIVDRENELTQTGALPGGAARYERKYDPAAGDTILVPSNEMRRITERAGQRAYRYQDSARNPNRIEGSVDLNRLKTPEGSWNWPAVAQHLERNGIISEDMIANGELTPSGERQMLRWADEADRRMAAQARNEDLGQAQMDRTTPQAVRFNREVDQQLAAGVPPQNVAMRAAARFGPGAVAQAGMGAMAVGADQPEPGVQAPPAAPPRAPDELANVGVLVAQDPSLLPDATNRRAMQLQQEGMPPEVAQIAAKEDMMVSVLNSPQGANALAATDGGDPEMVAAVLDMPAVSQSLNATLSQFMAENAEMAQVDAADGTSWIASALRTLGISAENPLQFAAFQEQLTTMFNVAHGQARQAALAEQGEMVE
jgi:hypothetical protein